MDGNLLNEIFIWAMVFVGSLALVDLVLIFKDIYHIINDD